MNKSQLHSLITLGEGQTLEFKRANTSGLGRELCALANAQGGYILIGEDDQGQIHPVKEPNKLKSEFALMKCPVTIFSGPTIYAQNLTNALPNERRFLPLCQRAKP